MIIVKILGGLGNQFFQYLFYRSLIIKNFNVKVDISEFDNYKLHDGLEIQKFIEPDWDIASDFEISKLKDSSHSLLSKFRRVCFNKYKRSHVREFQFKLNNLSNYKDAYLDGYWQNSTYLKNSYSEISKIIKLKDIDLDEKNNDILNYITQSESVGIHVRRGDFLSSKNKEIYYSCSLNYYRKAVDHFIEKDCKFFIFSDDIKWVQNEIKIPNAVYVDFNSGPSSFNDFYLLTKCKHLIIANSTYSWWAAALGLSTNNKVIAPKYWKKNSKDPVYLPDGWITIDNR